MESSSKLKSRQIISRMEDLPSCVLVGGILQKLDLETLCTVACVSTTLRSSVSEALAVLPSLHLSEVYFNCETIDKLMSRCTSLKTLTLNCLRLNGDSIIKGIGPKIEELILLQVYTSDARFFQQIEEKCPNLRVFVLETRRFLDLYYLGWLSKMLSKCKKLESFCLKIQPNYLLDDNQPRTCASLIYMNSMPRTIKSLTLDPVNEHQATALVYGLSYFSSLQKLSLVLEIITDNLVLKIAKYVPHLSELDLTDDPLRKAEASIDLSNVGLQAIGNNCANLKTLALVRRHNYFPGASFDFVDDTGFLFLSSGCREIESLTLTGFTEVGDVGFRSILQLPKLKKFEAGNFDILTDEAFSDLDKGPCSLTEVNLFTTMFTEKSQDFTSNILKPISSNSRLERLNFRSALNVTAPEIEYISFLNRLTSLDLTDTDVTDEGLLALSKGSAPIKSLSLRSCERITDHGISILICNGGTISKTLTTLDLGMICGITDAAIETIANSAFAVTELCLKYCHGVTESSINALARKGLLFDVGRNKPLRKLDIAYCELSEEYLRLLLGGTFFKGLRWLGVDGTPCCERNGVDEGVGFSAVFKEVIEQRPWLTVCTRGCDMGCNDQWNYSEHRFDFLLSDQAPTCFD